MQKVIMIIAYLYERPFEDGAAMGAEKTFADYPKTNRAELGDLITGGGLVAGDVLRVRAVSDLGRGQESKRLQKMVADLGVTLEVVPAEIDVRLRGRPQKAEIETIEVFDHLCGLWYSPTPAAACYAKAKAKAKAKVGADVDKQWFEYRCGPRHGRKEKEKRAKMLKNLTQNQEHD